MAKFKVIAEDKKARVGKLISPRGTVDTPVFLPVGTQASVKALSPQEVKATGCQMILANTYHLYLRPGSDTIQKLGGLHRFMDWDRPLMTDSGGFQVFSLGFGIEHEVGKITPLFAGEVLSNLGDLSNLSLVPRIKLCKVEEEGPTFQSHLDGTVHFFPPEKSVEVQVALGADFIVALDECTSPLHDYNYTKASMERSHRWELRSLSALKKRNLKLKISNLKFPKNQEIFGVVQGGPYKDLRIQSAKFVSKNDFFGIGIGGALVNRKKMTEILGWMNPHLDPAKPRHLLGIGTIPDIFLAVEKGIDMFDCSSPTRLGRMGHILYQKERFAFDITKSVFREDSSPIDPDCKCFACQNFSRAYIHHLFRSKELLAYRLATIHNVHFMMRLMEKIREAITDRRLAKLREEWVK